MDTYYVDDDPDDTENEGFFSVFCDNGGGFSYEVAGKIGVKEMADKIAAFLTADLKTKADAGQATGANDSA